MWKKRKINKIWHDLQTSHILPSPSDDFKNEKLCVIDRAIFSLLYGSSFFTFPLSRAPLVDTLIRSKPPTDPSSFFFFFSLATRRPAPRVQRLSITRHITGTGRAAPVAQPDAVPVPARPLPGRLGRQPAADDVVAVRRRPHGRRHEPQPAVQRAAGARLPEPVPQSRLPRAQQPPAAAGGAAGVATQPPPPPPEGGGARLGCAPIRAVPAAAGAAQPVEQRLRRLRLRRRPAGSVEPRRWRRRLRSF